MSLLCKIAGHRRSAKTARFDYDLQSFRSACRHCGAPMTRSPAGKWTLDPAE